MKKKENTLTKSTESQIVNNICEYLARKKYLFWRNNNTPIYDTKGGFFRAMPKYTMKGLPDIVVIREGWFIGLEVKRPKGVQSEYQKEFQRLCENDGAEYYVVTGIDDLIEVGL